MDPNNIKSNLKEAQKNVKLKNYKEALKFCKKVFKEDKKNGEALVITGFCLLHLNQMDQCFQAYSKAVHFHPEYIQGWCGLLSYYVTLEQKEKILETQEILCQLCEKSGKSDKFFEVSSSLISSYTEKQNKEQVVNLMTRQIRFTQNFPNSNFSTQEYQSSLVQYLSTYVTEESNSENENLLAETLKCLIDVESNSIQNMTYLKTFLSLSYKLRNMEVLVEKAKLFSILFPKSKVGYEWLCKIYLEFIVSADMNSNVCLYVNESTAVEATENLLRLSSSSVLGLMSQAALSWKNNEMTKSLDLLSKIKWETSNNFYGSWLYSKVLEHFGKITELELACKISEKLLESRKVKCPVLEIEFKRQLKIMQLKVLYRLFKIEDSLVILKEMIHDLENLDVKIIASKIQALTGKKICDEETHDLLFGIQAFAQGQRTTSLEKLIPFLETDFEAGFLLGQIYGESKDFENSITCLLKSAKLNPFNSQTFYFLGCSYVKIENLEKGRKCFIKSLNLNSSSSKDVQIALSDVYRALGDNDANLKLLTSVTSSNPLNEQNLWAFLRLGFVYLKMESPNEAILALQAALRLDPNNQVVMEAVADAHFIRGSYITALKIFEKVVKMNSSSSLYSSYKIACIQQILGSYDDSIAGFKNVLSHQCHHLPSIKGLAESLLKKGSLLLNEVLDANFIDCINEAFEILSVALSMSSKELSVFWSLLGKACVLTSSCSPSIFSRNFKWPHNLIGVHNVDSIKDLLVHGSSFYREAIKINPRSGALWHDLSLTYLYAQDWESGIKALNKALELDSVNDLYWNTYGLFAYYSKNYPLSQVSYIQSLVLRPTAKTWTNLGVLYLQLGDLSLANKAFQESQNNDPSYIKGWVGQGILAELSHSKETMDLFRHATFLGIEMEAASAFSLSVVQTLIEMKIPDRVSQLQSHNIYCIEKMYGVSLALDSLERYTRRIETDANAWFAFGILLEDVSRIKEALRAYRRVESLNSSLLPIGTIGRLLLKNGDFSSAITQLKTLENKGNFDAVCNLALAYSGNGNFGEAYRVFGLGLSLTERPCEKARILIALSSIAYKVQGPNPCKTLLFQACQIHPSCTQALLSLGVLGIKNRDGPLFTAAFRELVNNKENTTLDAITLKTAALHLLENKDRETIVFLCKYIHERPNESRLWTLLSEYCKENKDRVSMAYKSALNSYISCSKNSNKESKEKSGTLLLSILRTRNEDSARKYFSKIVHEFPWRMHCETIQNKCL